MLIMAQLIMALHLVYDKYSRPHHEKLLVIFLVMFRKASSVLRLPSSLVNGIFGHFSALRVSKDALDAVQVG